VVACRGEVTTCRHYIRLGRQARMRPKNRRRCNGGLLRRLDVEDAISGAYAVGGIRAMINGLLYPPPRKM
jgi:hypothetical protein